MGAAAVQGSSCTPWAGLGSKAPFPPQEQGCPHGQVWPGSAIAGHRILTPPCSRAHPATQIPISWPDSPLRPLIHCGRLSTPAPTLSTQGTPSLLLLQKRPPSRLCWERGPSLAGPARGLCAGTWQPGTLSAPSARLALLRRQRSVPGPSCGTAVPLLGQPARGRPLERCGRPCSATCSPVVWHQLPSLGATPVRGSGEHGSILGRCRGCAEPCSGPCPQSIADVVGKGRGMAVCCIPGAGSALGPGGGCPVGAQPHPAHPMPRPSWRPRHKSPCVTCLVDGAFLLSLCFCQMTLVCVFEKWQITTAQ